MKIEKKIKSPMNYIGGKYKLLEQIIPLFPSEIDGDFIDLFCGGCDIAINVTGAKRVIANDYNGDIIKIYKEIQKRDIGEVIRYIEEVIDRFSLTISNSDSYNNFRGYYNGQEVKNPIDLFILICYSFNHQVRFNNKGEFNMPFGKNRSYFNNTIKNNLILFHKAISQNHIIFTSNNFSDLKIDKLNSNDFVYCDPPYLITCATYNERDGWNEDTEKRLYMMLDKLNEKKTKFAVSNVLSNKGKENSILKSWSSNYNVHHLNKSYSNCSYHAIDKSTTTTEEVLITNY